jgi:sec-independent protein translocase protein TatB
MPSFADDIVLAILALLLFGPKKLPVLARELGKWVAEFRRASNEFKYQMEEELRQAEQADRQKQIAAMEAAAPVAPALTSGESISSLDSVDSHLEPIPESTNEAPSEPSSLVGEHSIGGAPAEAAPQATEPLPIATSGSLSMMPPDTGLPVSRSSSGNSGSSNAISPLLDSIPETKEEAAHAD